MRVQNHQYVQTKGKQTFSRSPSFAQGETSGLGCCEEGRLQRLEHSRGQAERSLPPRTAAEEET